MFSCRTDANLVAVLFALLAPVSLLAGDSGSRGASVPAPKLGHVVGEEALEPWNVTVFPDGTGLPSGGGSVDDGATLYDARCASCHGAKGEGALADRLVGGWGTLQEVSPVRTVGSFWPYATTLFDYVRRSMPYEAPKSLTSDEVYAITAYVLFLNEIVAEDAVMDATTLPRIEMPNRDGFVSDYP
ncbi:MAG: cytochrome c [Gammaproteobacteria bacterium]|nr:cytochrome c [Gammaproteobacteria bacterium]